MELISASIVILTAFLLVLVNAFASANHPGRTIVINQNIGIWAYLLEFLIAFVIFPKRANASNTEEGREEGGPSTRVDVRDGLFHTLNDADLFPALMEHCADEYCIENLLALVEIREFKRCLRKELCGVVSGDEKADEHERLFRYVASPPSPQNVMF